MIIVALRGGLGNQLFQYATGYALARASNGELLIDTTRLDGTSPIPGDTYRPYALDAFHIPTRRASSEQIRTVRHPFGTASRIIEIVTLKLFRRYYIGWDPSVLKRRGNVYLNGYFQSPKYFESERDALLKIFSLREEFGLEARRIFAQIQASDAVSIHVRRGDYVANTKPHDTPDICSLEYYAKAVAKIRERISNPVWFVFSDDMSWVTRNLALPGRTVYVSGNTIPDAHELMLMAECDHNIIANSSFSWWGAWLNQNPLKIVVAPMPWFNTKKDQHKDLIPESWIRLPKN